MSWDSHAQENRDPVTQRGMGLIGTAIRLRRQRLGLSQEDVQQLTGIHQSTISRLENGRRCGLRWSRFARLVAVFDGLDFSPSPRSSRFRPEHDSRYGNPYLERLALAQAADAEHAAIEIALGRGPARLTAAEIELLAASFAPDPDDEGSADTESKSELESRFEIGVIRDAIDRDDVHPRDGEEFGDVFG